MRPSFNRRAPASGGKANRALQWLQLFRHSAVAAVSIGVLSMAVSDPEQVPAGFIPVLVAAATALAASVICAIAAVAALRARNADAALRVASALWIAGIVGTFFAAILVIANSPASPGILAAVFAVPFLVVAKPPRRSPRGGDVRRYRG